MKKEYGKPVMEAGSKLPPDYDEALALLLRLQRLLAPGAGSKRRLELARLELQQANGYQVYTRNMLNPDAGLIPIAAGAFGTACDPGTERYHCM